MLTGYTAFMLKLLKRQRILFIDRKMTKMGGKTQAEMRPIIDTCLQRMRNWVVLARSVVRAEFPHFESMQAFDVWHSVLITCIMCSNRLVVE